MASITPPHLLPPKHRDPLLSEEYATFLDKVYSKLCKQLPDYISSLLDTFRHDMTEKEYQDFKELDESPTTVSLIINWVYKDKDRFIPFVKFIVFQVPHIYIGMPSLPVCSSFAHPKSEGCENSLLMKNTLLMMKYPLLLTDSQMIQSTCILHMTLIEKSSSSSFLERHV